jgi:hypothetical protein
LGLFFNNDDPIPDESSLMILNVNFQFNDFMNNTADVYADDLKIASLIFMIGLTITMIQKLLATNYRW